LAEIQTMAQSHVSDQVMAGWIQSSSVESFSWPGSTERSANANNQA
jgi:hypothetical protein